MKPWDGPNVSSAAIEQSVPSGLKHTEAFGPSRDSTGPAVLTGFQRDLEKIWR